MVSERVWEGEGETDESDWGFSRRREGREDTSHRLHGVRDVVRDSVLRSMSCSSDSDYTTLLSFVQIEQDCKTDLGRRRG